VNSDAVPSRRVWAAVAIALVARLATLVPRVIDDDEAWFAASARALSHPFDFFRAAPDNKPPGTVWFYEAVRAVLGAWHLPQTARLLGLLLLAGTCVLLARIAQRLSPGTGPRAALLLALASGALAPQLFALTNEQLMIAPVTFAVFAALELRGRSRWLFAGVAVGLSCWVKQTGVLFLLPVLLACESVLEGALVIAACLLTVGAQIVAVGPRDFWQWTWVYPREVLVRAREVAFASWGDALQSLFWALFVLWPLWLAFARRARERLGGRRVVLGWAAAAALAIASGKALFLHYFLLALPPVCLVAAQVPDTRWSRRWLWVTYAAMLAIAAVPFSSLFWGNDVGYFTRVARRIEQASSPADRVFVWGGSPVPQALADRDHPTRFVTSRYLVYPYGSPSTEATFREEFEARPPELLVDLHARGDNRQNVGPEELDWLGKLLRERYAVYADPTLPWARFYFRADRTAPRGLCRSAPIDAHAQEYPHSLEALKEAIADARSGRLHSTELLALERRERASFALEALETSCGSTEAGALRTGLARGPDPLERARALFATVSEEVPLALASRAWWIELAIVELQPVTPRQLAPKH
jgi:hypothetical protein